MGKVYGMAEFKARCTRIVAEVERTGEPVTITKRGRPVAEVTSVKPAERPAPLTFGCMKGTIRILGDIVGPIDPDWEQEWEAKWEERGFPKPAS